MDLEKYTERSKGFVQSAQGMALRSGHQRLTPEHLGKVLLEDKEGLCANLTKAAGGDPKIVLAQIEAELNRQPRVEGRRQLRGQIGNYRPVFGFDKGLNLAFSLDNQAHSNRLYAPCGQTTANLVPQ